MSELATCGHCGTTAEVKLKGTNPRGWYSRFISPGNMPLFCSRKCLDDSRDPHVRAVVTKG